MSAVATRTSSPTSSPVRRASRRFRPILSWARQSNKLAYVYYEKGNYDVYVLDKPESRKKAPWRAGQMTVAQAPAVGRGTPPPPATARDTAGTVGGTSLYRSATGLRPADSLGKQPDSLKTPAELSIVQLIDSTKHLPDTNTFSEHRYKTVFTPDYVARPSIGYARSNFGSTRACFGGHVGAALRHARRSSAPLQRIYQRPHRRSAGARRLRQPDASHQLGGGTISQDPYFFYNGSRGYGPGLSESQEATYVTEVRRIVLRSAFLTGYPPSSPLPARRGGTAPDQRRRRDARLSPAVRS